MRTGAVPHLLSDVPRLRAVRATGGAAGDAAELVHEARRLALYAREDVDAQRDLAAAQRGEISARMREVEVQPLLRDLARRWTRHPVARARIVRVRPADEGQWILTDPALLQRAVGSLVKNALEAALPGEDVTLWYDRESSSVHVHHHGVMRASLQSQVLARLLAERYLQGGLRSTSEPWLGTTVSVVVPAADGSSVNGGSERAHRAGH